MAGDLNLNLNLADLGLSGDFALTPSGFDYANRLIGTDTSRIFNQIGGTLLAPTTWLDLDEIEAAIQVRANELEVDSLEALRAADAERQRATDEAHNKLIAEQRQWAAKNAARVAAEAAAKQAEKEAAHRA
ncbi:MAG: hypothetical protein MO846_01440 [Candidatus Devosia symbiotica]|nr:hypothetical protein [Candidatus Devosia symbiotica]